MSLALEFSGARDCFNGLRKVRGNRKTFLRCHPTGAFDHIQMFRAIEW
jgi:hypothetical protein